MTVKLSALAMPVFVLVLGFAGASSAMDAMPMEKMNVDPMAAECMTSAGMETDMGKMDAMVTDCKAKYPDAAAIECMMKAHMETDMAKMDAMNAECKAMYPNAIMGDAMMSTPMANDAMAGDAMATPMANDATMAPAQ